MERKWHSKSRSSSPIRGNVKIQKQNSAPKSNFGAHSYSGETAKSYRKGATKEDKFLPELRKHSSKCATGTPMKKLLAEETSKDIDRRRRSPSIIARLMGLDGLPSAQHVDRQRRLPSEKYQQASVSADVPRSDNAHKGNISGRNSLDHQEIKDVYEDMEALHVVNRHYHLRLNRNELVTKSKMANIPQKFLNRKGVYTDKNLHGPEEGSNRSNNDLLKFLLQPDSSITKHLQDKKDHSGSHCHHVSVLKSLKSEIHEGNFGARKPGRDVSCPYHKSPHHKRKDGLLLQLQNHHNVSSFLEPSEVRLEENDEKISPARIVVLKPTPWRKRVCVPSPDLAQTLGYSRRMPSEFLEAKSGSTRLRNEDSSYKLGFSREKSKEAREITKEIKSRVVDTIKHAGRGQMHCRSKGYTGDESSYGEYESDSTIESGKLTISSKNSLCRTVEPKPSSSSSSEASVSSEAKEMLSERWKTGHVHKDTAMRRKGSTLEEMLALPDSEMMHEFLNFGGWLDGFSDIKHSPGREFPLGISSRDGWKAAETRQSSSRSRSRSLSPSFGNNSRRTDGHSESFIDDIYLFPRDSYSRSRSKSVNDRQCLKEGNLSKDTRSFHEKPHPNSATFSDAPRSSPEASFSPTQSYIKDKECDSFGQQLTASQAPAVSDSCSSPIIDSVTDPECESLTVASESSVELLLQQPAFTEKTNNSAACTEGVSNQQGPLHRDSIFKNPGPEPKSSKRSDEADHPSPDSVLEVPSPEDVSSGSECLERVSVKIQELKMRLQLLERESGGYAEGPEPATQEALIISEGHCEESWKTSYTTDVLSESGLEDSDPSVLIAMWHSPECPVAPWIFDDLEKKYSDGTSGPRYERMLLFDRINSALLEIFQQHTKQCPWATPATRGPVIKQHYDVKDVLLKLLTIAEDSRDIKRSGMVLDKEMHWVGFRDEIDEIGKDIAKLFIDDLITEVFFSVEVLEQDMYEQLELLI